VCFCSQLFAIGVFVSEVDRNKPDPDFYRELTHKIGETKKCLFCLNTGFFDTRVCLMCEHGEKIVKKIKDKQYKPERDAVPNRDKRITFWDNADDKNLKKHFKNPR